MSIPAPHDKPMPQRWFIVAMTPVRHSKMMLYIREGWVRSMNVYTKPYDRRVYTLLHLHPSFKDIAPLEVQEWMRYNTTDDEGAAKDVYATHQRRKTGI